MGKLSEGERFQASGNLWSELLNMVFLAAFVDVILSRLLKVTEFGILSFGQSFYSLHLQPLSLNAHTHLRTSTRPVGLVRFSSSRHVVHLTFSDTRTLVIVDQVVFGFRCFHPLLPSVTSTRYNREPTKQRESSSASRGDIE